MPPRSSASRFGSLVRSDQECSCQARADGNALAEFALSWETQVANYLEFLPLAFSEFELTFGLSSIILNLMQLPVRLSRQRTCRPGLCVLRRIPLWR